jgi:hypothetical protein
MANPETGNQQKTRSHERFTGPIVPETLTPRRWCPNPGDDDDDDHNNSRWLLLSLKLKIAQRIDFPLSYYYSVHNNNTHTQIHTRKDPSSLLQKIRLPEGFFTNYPQGEKKTHNPLGTHYHQNNNNNNSKKKQQIM